MSRRRLDISFQPFAGSIKDSDSFLAGKIVAVDYRCSLEARNFRASPRDLLPTCQKSQIKVPSRERGGDVSLTTKICNVRERRVTRRNYRPDCSGCTQFVHWGKEGGVSLAQRKFPTALAGSPGSTLYISAGVVTYTPTKFVFAAACRNMRCYRGCGNICGYDSESEKRRRVTNGRSSGIRERERERRRARAPVFYLPPVVRAKLFRKIGEELPCALVYKRERREVLHLVRWSVKTR